MIRKLLVVGAAMAMPVSMVAFGGVASAKTVVPPDPSVNITVGANVNFSAGLSAFGVAGTDKTSSTNITDQVLNGTNGNGDPVTGSIATALAIPSKGTKCGKTATPAALTAAGPTSFSTATDPNAGNDANAQAANDATGLKVPATCVAVTPKTKKGVTTYSLKASKLVVLGSLGGFASTGSTSLGKALKKLNVTVTDNTTGTPIAYAIKTSSTTEVIGGACGSEVGFVATGTVGAPKADKGQAATLTACLGTVTAGTGGAQGQSFLAVFGSGNPAEVINTVVVDPATSSFTIG